MTSKTRLTELVKAFDWKAVAEALKESPALLGVRDQRGRTWLHIACATPPKSPAATQASIETADVLLAAGIDINDAAFTEGSWRATPLWCAIGRGNNLALARHLLELGCDPEHCLYAAQFGRKPDAIRLLVAHGARIDPFVEGATPFLEAVAWSHFEEAEVFLELGADVDAKNRAGLTALHLMLKKNTDLAWLEMVVAHGARGDLPGPDGRTAIEIMRKKRDPRYQALADRFVAASAC
jgi:ankyrin repeat protein